MEIGDYVQKNFKCREPNEQKVASESMWVKITRFDGDDIVGVLRNDPVAYEKKCGDIVRFSRSEGTIYKYFRHTRVNETFSQLGLKFFEFVWPAKVELGILRINLWINSKAIPFIKAKPFLEIHLYYLLGVIRFMSILPRTDLRRSSPHLLNS